MEEKQNPLKEYGQISRNDSLNAVEWAIPRILGRIDFYISLNEVVPQQISLKSEKYSSDYCASLLRTALIKKGIESKVSISQNGDVTGLILNVDEFADQYFTNPCCTEDR